MILRDYQSRTISDVIARIEAGERSTVIVAPCGAGKTVLACELIRIFSAQGKRSLVLAHRKELIDQTVDKLKRFGIEAGVIMAQDNRRDDWLPVQVASTQTLARRKKYPPADLVIYDECHHSCSTSGRDIIAVYPSAISIGLTATPWRTDKFGLADLYSGHVVAASMRQLQSLGSLVEYDAFAYDAPELRDVPTVAGDWNQKQLGIACNTDVLVGSVVTEYVKHASGMSAILFPVNIEHSKHLVAEFSQHGIAADHLDCHTSKQDRERILGGLASGAVTVVSSVGVLTEGFDCPSVQVCILARPTKSLSLYIQMVGRALRPAPGKTRALIHDHAGNILRHGLPDDDRDYSLSATPKRVTDAHTCPRCLQIFGKLADGECPKCGCLLESPYCEQCGKVKNTECKCKERDVRPELKKYTVQGKRLGIKEIRELRAALGVRELTPQQTQKVYNATREEKAAEYLRLVAVQKAKGFKPGFVAHQYRAVFGAWPKFNDGDLEGVTPLAKPFIPLAPRTDDRITIAKDDTGVASQQKSFRLASEHGSGSD